jgi:hypothetical protein
MATPEDVDAFVEASDELCEGVEPLDAGNVVALIGALDAGDDHPEVRWTVLHVIESQDAAPYLLGTVEALARNPGSEWAGLLVGRLAHAPGQWGAIARALAAVSKEERARGIAAVRALADALDGGADPKERERERRVAGLADALVAGG